ncbi:hypothetical protein DL766_007253 [Monosporascus sp. MC13-8B]|uniref:Mitochondrial thiamine pyrophosphate carrier 1 n=1 Tax=Monosporascus cannonballus TaxID=155416 RepID=A0ABY0H1B0_9PEZI|nr:hypothetical protein DL762_006813 [Monosporascus cannonballus]RYO83354.1 hypothetical protein DL763_007889 [Monosporascus cannonballus]RYP24559.1 hypothetical protein DL766_007253 [Monosporascus sp. MC13-8B]
MPDIQTSTPVTRREGTDTFAGRMDGVVRRAGAARDRAVKKTDPGAVMEPDQSLAAPEGIGKKELDKHSLGYAMRSGIAGGLAGCAAKTTVAPLDRVKILFQTSNPQFAKYSSSWTGFGRAVGDIYARDGVRGLFRGHSATLLKIYPYAAIKFVAYEQYRALLIGRHADRETWLRRFSAGALAGVTSVFFTYPLEVVRVRLAFETKHRSSSLAEICRKIYHEHPLPKPVVSAALNSSSPGSRGSGGSGGGGAAALLTSSAPRTAGAPPRSGLTNFYRGFSTTLLGMVPYAGVSFLTHDTAGDLLRHPRLRAWTTAARPAGYPEHKPEPLRAWAELVSGGVSGLVSQTVSYPLEVIRRRMQVGGAVGDGRRLRIAETARMILRERGPRGFFVGLTIGYVKIVPLAAVSFYAYERLKTLCSI